MENRLAPFLASSDIIDWHHPQVSSLAGKLAGGDINRVAIARRCFEWVRDEIRHSWDHRLNPVTCAASEVLEHGTGFCYAKSHLLAALLRASGIPAGFCYQRLSIDDHGAPFSLHGLNAVHLPEFGWYRIDARGNRQGVDARFTPPVERLAFTPRIEGEVQLPDILSAPRQEVIAALRQYRDIHDLWAHLPDVSV